jgi:Spy/CpxP family protein refolding chaperone
VVRVSLVVLVLSAAGCAANSATGRPGTGASGVKEVDDAETDALREHHRYHHGGETLFLAMGLDTLGVSAEQQTAVDKIRADLRAAMAPVRAAEQRLLETLGTGLSRGQIDVPSVNASVLDVSSAAQSARDASATSLDELHAVLTPPQRAALADKVESHWAVWRAENAEARGQTGGATRGHLAALSTELELSPDQEQRIRTALAGEWRDEPPFDLERAGTRVHALAEAFRLEQFEARTVEQGAASGMAGWGAAHLARVVEAMNPVLTPEQRDHLARKLLEHASHAAGPEGHS